MTTPRLAIGPGTQRDRRTSTDGPFAPAAEGGARPWHRRDIEGLRAVAVLLVVAYHCGIDAVPGGYVGVDVFLVISGFLITSLLLREIRARGTLSIPGFYARRALRLLPAATVVVVATVAAAARWLPPLRRGDILLDAWYATGSALNYRLAAIGTDYLGAAGEPSPLQHYWSLAVEEQFYLVWPPLLLLAAVGLSRRGPGRRELGRRELGRRELGRREPRTARVYAALGTIVVVSFALSVTLTARNASWAYFGAHTRAWELGVGALVAVSAGAYTRLPRWATTSLNTAGVLAVGVAAAAYSPATPFPGYAALLPVLGTAAVIVAGCTAPSRWLSTPVPQGIGRLSYSWYLWHWPFLIVVPAALGITATWWQNALIVAAAFVAALLTYMLVERPVQRLGGLKARPWRGLVTGGGLLASSAGLCLLVTTVAGWGAGTVSYRAPSVAEVSFDTGHLAQVIAQSVNAPAVPANLTPSLARAAADRPQLNRDGCDPAFTDSQVKTPCAYGDLASTYTVVLFGDSHAGHWFPALERIAIQRHWRLVAVTKSACSAADAAVFHEKLRREYTECTTWRAAAWRHIAALRPKLVFMSSVSTGDMLRPHGDQDRAWAMAWARSADRVSRTGARLYYLGDTPWQEHIVPECLSGHLHHPQTCARSRAQALLQPYRRRAVMQAMRAHGATVIDPVPWFCTASTCPVVIGNVLVYKDAHHMTTVYSRLLAPLLSAAIGADQQ